MQPQHWKIFLILGAMIVAASLVVPKALRKNIALAETGNSQTLLPSQNPQVDERQNGSNIQFGFHEVVPSTPQIIQLCVEENQCPLGEKTYPLKYGEGYLILKERVIVTAADLQTAVAGLHPHNNDPVVNFVLDTHGAKKFCEFTSSHIGEPFAIVLESEIVTRPNISGAICSGRGFIEGNFTMEEAEELALSLNAGTRPPKMRVVK